MSERQTFEGFVMKAQRTLGPREISGEYFAELPVVGLRIEGLLVFPLLRKKVTALSVKSAVSKDPRRGWRQNLNALKNCPIL